MSNYTEDLPSTTKGNEPSYVANPRAPKGGEIDEPTGPVASDSLAAESYRAGGGFAENKGGEPLGVRGAASTLANTDTSGADILHAAPSGSVREQQDLKGLGRDEKGTAGGVAYPAGAGQPDFSGTTSDQGYVGGPAGGGQGTSTADYSGSGGIDTSYSGSGTGDITSSGTANISNTATGVRPYVDTAPGYADAPAGRLRTEGELRPKGDNLTEGGDIPPNRSTFTGDVGGPKDPGRVAEATFQQYNAQSGLDAGQTRSSLNQTDQGDKGGFENLDSSERT